MAYNTKYRIEYEDIINKTTIINIKENGYNSEVIFIDKVAYSPLRYRVNGEGGNKYATVKSSEINIGLLSEIDYQWFEFSNFEEKRYQVEIIYDTVPIWSGFLVPDNYRELYTTPPYNVSITATDYLSTLKDYDFADIEGNYDFGNLTALEIVLFCLNKLELNLDIWDSTDTFPKNNSEETETETPPIIDECTSYNLIVSETDILNAVNNTNNELNNNSIYFRYLDCDDIERIYSVSDFGTFNNVFCAKGIVSVTYYNEDIEYGATSSFGVDSSVSCVTAPPEIPLPEETDLGRSALEQVYIDTKKYIKSFGTENESPSNCKEVIDDILTTFGLTLYQNKNHWELKHFDSFVKTYYIYNFDGVFLESILSEVVREVDDLDLYLVKEDSELEVEGAFRKINLIHNLGEKNFSIRGGGFGNSDWVNDNLHKYFTYTGAGGTFSRNGNRGYFTKQVDNTTYTGSGSAANTNVLNASKADFVTIQVPFTRLPIPQKNVDYHLDLDFFTQLVVDYVEPIDIDDPAFNQETYASFLEQQLTQLYSNLVYGCHFQLKIVNTTRNTTYYHRFNPTGMDEESNVIDNRWSYGSALDDWDALITDMISENGNIDPLKVKKKYNELDGSAAPSNFINDDYEYKLRIQLFENSASILKLIGPSDVGFIELKISAPYFFQVQNYHSGIPTDYRININRVNQYIRKIDFTNEQFTKANTIKTVIGDNDSNIRVMEDLNLNLGDGNVLSLNSLFDENGEVFPYFTKGDVEAKLLQHTANRIINQYSEPSMRLRGTIYTKDSFIDLSQIIYIENLDKFFGINTFDYEGIEAQYKVELIELLGFSGFGNRQLTWIKGMALSVVDNVDGYSIIVEENDN